MQAAAPKQAKKPGFKCPTFSVPARPENDKTVKQETAPEKKRQKEQEKAKKKSLPSKTAENPTPDGDNESGNVNVELTQELPNSSGDTKECETKEPSSEVVDSKTEINGNPLEDKQTTKDSVESSLLKVTKKKKTDFKVKPKVEGDKKSAVNKKNDKPKKKKAVVDVQKEEGNQTYEDLHADKAQKKNEIVKEVKKQKEKKIKKTKEKKDGSESKPKPTLPVRSLTDEEYDVIFDAAIENALHLNIEEWEPKVKRKFSITVGKKVEKTKLKVPQESVGPSQEQSKKTENQSPGMTSQEKPRGAEEDKQVDENQEQVQDAKDDREMDENNNIDHVMENENDAADEINDAAEEINDAAEEINDAAEEINDAAEEINDAAVDVEADQDSAQRQNESTPAGSEVDSSEKKPDCVTTPVKKKKKKISKLIKNPKLEPKQLPFERQPKAPMLDKIQQMKKKDKRDAKQNKRKLDHDAMKSGKTLRNSSDCVQEKKRPKLVQKRENKRQKMQHRELELNGTWVQCCNSTCMKWRYLSDISDPTSIPERWTCSMNSNKKYNSCDKAEESYDESEHIYTKFSEGSVVWARMTGYPWWPALVEIDPNAETFFSVDTQNSMFPTHYHVVFFDDHVSRAWVRTEHMIAFSGDEDKDGILYRFPKKGKSYLKEIGAAKKNAARALSCTIKERIELFGFAARYKGPWVSKSKEISKREKPVPSKRIADKDEEYLDDSTMDDVIGNTEALLDNVEEMLDSIDSQLMDTDADSDFEPDTLIVVETKKKRTEKRIGLEEKMAIKEDDTMDEKSEVDIESREDEAVNELEEKSKDETGVDVKSMSSKDAFSKLNLDNEIFTMEMNSQDKHGPTDSETDEAGIEKVKHKKKKGNKTQTQSENKSEDKLDDKEQKEDLKKSIDEMSEETEVDKKETDDTKKETDASDCNGEGTSSENCHENELDSSALEFEEKKNTELAKDKIRMELDVADNQLKLDDRENLTNLEETEGDVISENIDESAIIEDISSASPQRELERNPGQSLENDSDNEFDLEDHYMYDTNTDGADKIRERVLNQVINEVEEDSDPFDLMEE